MTAIGSRPGNDSATPVAVSATSIGPETNIDTVRAIALKYSDIVGLERSIDVAYQIASQRLFDVFFDKYRLLDHLLALKHYLLLGYGDFADQLMDTLGYGLLRSTL